MMRMLRNKGTRSGDCLTSRSTVPQIYDFTLQRPAKPRDVCRSSSVHDGQDGRVPHMTWPEDPMLSKASSRSSSSAADCVDNRKRPQQFPGPTTAAQRC